VSQPPLGSKYKQGFELQLATNCLGPFLLTQLLLPVLEKAATSNANVAEATGRVVWLSSQVMELSAPKGAIIMSDLTNAPNDQVRNYTTSKTANYLLSCELARRESASKRIISVAINSGAANTRLFRHSPWMKMLAWPMLYKPQVAAYTELYAGLSPEISFENNGCYVIPWGQIHTSLREDLVLATHPIAEGGDGKATELWEYCEEKTNVYAK
jgi:NAD(P)-dependent dehydrogenase (short-subunit alcohol dehydrogenase family)